MTRHRLGRGQFISRQFSPGLRHIYWCMNCNVPLLQEKCGLCGKTGKRVFLSPPGDIRPALKDGVTLIKSLFREEFGTDKFLDDKIILLNKISGMDRREQIIIDSFNVATLEFSLETLSYVLLLNINGALLISDLTTRKTVQLDREKIRGCHLKGKKINGEIIAKMSSDVKIGNTVIVKSGDVTGIGIALCDTDTIKGNVSAVRIKDLSSNKRITFSNKKAGSDEFVRANIKSLENLERNAVCNIQGVVNESKQDQKGIPLSVSFSGGKDSLAALFLASQAMRDFDVIFVDTGLEFPETINYVRDFCKKHKYRLVQATAGDTFWQNVDRFGPPGKDYRWCCKTCKLAPLAEIIGQQYPYGVITIEGNRIYESFSRAKLELVSRNPFVPNQIIINPIRNWRALEVWLYIMWKRFPYNPLYDKDYERIGCWLCPASLSSEFQKLNTTHPQLYIKWLGYLSRWASEKGFPPEYATHGFWRWKELPPKMLELADKMGVKVLPQAIKKDTGCSLFITDGLSPCVTGGFSIEGVLKSSSNPSFSIIDNFMYMLGATRVSEDLGVVLIDIGKGASAKLFAGGQFVITAIDKSCIASLLKNMVRQLLRAQMCTHCGICEKSCPWKAIQIKKHVIVDKTRCNHCLKCADGCVVAKYADKYLYSNSDRYRGSS